MQKLRWGVLSTANIARSWVIPAIHASDSGDVVAIASRDAQAAERVAGEFGIPIAHGSYEALLADPQVDAIYNPLPNHLHVPLSLKALEAGKHVLCEKPLGMDALDAQRVVEAAQRHPHLNVMEAFMYRFHPQWKKVGDWVEGEAIGPIRSLHAQFSYCNLDPENIRNRPEWGGGGLMDIGCYGISAARLMFRDEPLRVSAAMKRDPAFGVDILTSALLEFPAGVATITCGTQMEPSQFVHASGPTGSIRIDSPFYRLDTDPSRVHLQRDREVDTLEFEGGNHYVDMLDAFAQAIFKKQPAPTPLSDAIANMKVIDAVFESAKTGRWVEIEQP